MNIPKAIEILDAIVKTGQYEGDPDDSSAMKLGIEALKAIKAWRNIEDDVDLMHLSGETEE